MKNIQFCSCNFNKEYLLKRFQSRLPVDILLSADESSRSLTISQVQGGDKIFIVTGFYAYLTKSFRAIFTVGENLTKGAIVFF